MLALASNEASASRGAALATAYCLGLGVPFLVTALAFGRVARVWSAVRRHQRLVQVLGGLLLVGVGVLLVTGAWTNLVARRTAPPPVHPGRLMAADDTGVRCRGSGHGARLASSGASSPACARRCSCSCCWRSPPYPARCCPSTASTSPRSRRTGRTTRSWGPGSSGSARSTSTARSWFSAIYLLLFVSLVGCLVPRTWQQVAALRQPPPRTPTRPERLPVSAQFEVEGVDRPDGSAQADEVADLLRRRHFRVAVQEGGRAVSAERGRLRELGNLGFHLSLVGLLLSVAAGHLWGWRGDVIVPVGSTTVDAVGAYSTLDLGPWVDAEDLPPFSLHVASMTVKFQTTGGEVGAPSEFKAAVDVQKGDGPTTRELLVC